MLIGPPSAHKTPAMKEAAHSALATIDHQLYLEWKNACEQIEVQHQMALDAQEAANKPKKSVKKPEKPPLKHLLHDDTSLEKLTINMAASPHGAVAFYSEFAAWFASFSRYSTGGDDSSGRALWNRAYDAERFKRDRVKNEGPPIVVPPPPARWSARSSPTSFGKSGQSLMTVVGAADLCLAAAGAIAIGTIRR